jgi:Ca-activated chloride channel family protein
MNEMTFAWPWCLLALPLPWLVRRLLPSVGATALRVPSLPQGTCSLPRTATIPRLFAMIAWVMLVAAAMRPQLPGDLLVRENGRGLMLAVDVSASMGTRDLQTDGKPAERLQVARQVAGEFFSGRDGDRIGLIVFGTQAYLHTPLTFDLVAAQDALGTAETGLAGPETALGDAIALAVKQLRDQPEQARVLILLTDGAATAGTLAPLRAAWLAQRDRVRVHAVGIGSAELDEAALKAVAAQTGGIYARATDTAALRAFFRQVAEIEPAARTGQQRLLRELYVWPLGLAFVLTCCLALRREREAVA